MKHTVTEHTLKTGTKGLLIDVPGSEVVNIVLRFNSGFEFSPSGKYELSHFVEHLIADGNKDHPSAEEFKVEFTKNGAFRNAYTSPWYNAYVAECAAFELPRILDLMVGYIGKPLFPQSDFSNELNNVREELNRLESEPGNVCSINLSSSLWPEETMTFRERLSQLEVITPEDVVDHYQHTHTAQNLRFYVVGSMAGNQDIILAKLNELARLLPKGERKALKPLFNKVQTKPIYEVRDLNSIYYHFALVTDELGLKERRVATLMRSILFGGYPSRVYGPMRKRGLAYTIGSSTMHLPGRSQANIYGFVTQATIQPLFELAATEVKRLADGDLDEAELTANKDRLLGGTIRTVQQGSDLLDWYLGSYDRWGLINDFDEEMEAYRAITPKEVVEVTGKFTAKKMPGISFLGQIDESIAKEYTTALGTLIQDKH